MTAFGISDLWIRYQAVNREEKYVAMKLLPEGDEAIL
jgi:hypothetical protein